MERTIRKVVKEPELKNTDVVLWKNTGGGSFRLGRRIIKPGEKFEATEKEVSQGFRDVLKQVGGTPTPVKKEQEQIPGVKPSFKVTPRVDKPSANKTSAFKMKPRKGGKDLYDVVSDVTVLKDGKKVKVEKPLNTVGLTKEKAEKLLVALSE